MKIKYLQTLCILFLLNIDLIGQNPILSISNPKDKCYLKFFIQEHKLSDNYVSLEIDTSMLQAYDGTSLPLKKHLKGTMLVFRSFFKLDKRLSGNELSFHIGSLNYPCRIFCNGKLLYTLGSYKDNYTSKIRFSSSVMVPPDFLLYDKVNELSIQIYQRYNESSSLGKLFIASKEVVDKYTFIRNFVSVNLIQATLILSFILAIYFLFLYGLKKDKRNIKYLLFSCFCIFLSLGYSNISFSFNYVNELLVYKISRMSLPFSSLFLLYFTIAATNVLVIEKWKATIFSIPILAFVLAFFIQDSIIDIEKILKIFASTVNIPYLILAFALVIISLVKKRRNADFALAIGFIVLFAAIYFDTKNYLLNLTPYTWLIPHGFLFFIVIIFFVLSTEQTKAFNLSIERELQLKELKDDLEKIVDERTSLIKTQNEELISQAEYLEQANFEIIRQKNIIEKSHKNITDSILYAGLIQKAVLPSDEIINMILPNHFIFYQPSNIVSGDFYFIRQVRQFTIVCAIDCTGHGIPGAFLSMLGTALLNEIVLNKEITEANQVLDELRNQIKISLQQNGKDGERKEGMDIAFCSIDLETMVLSFSGAHNSLWLFRPIAPEDVHPNNHSFEFIELEGDLQSVSVGYKEEPFGMHSIELKEGDVFYIFTDGYYSQFSYKNGATYKSKRFRELLNEIHPLPMHEQKAILEQNFEDWKGNAAQTDDVLVIGVKI